MNALRPVNLAAVNYDSRNQGAHLSNKENMDVCEVIIKIDSSLHTDILTKLSQY
jgi:hypothetical protein